MPENTESMRAGMQKTENIVEKFFRVFRNFDKDCGTLCFIIVTL